MCDCRHGLQDSTLWGDELPSALLSPEGTRLGVLRQLRGAVLPVGTGLCTARHHGPCVTCLLGSRHAVPVGNRYFTAGGLRVEHW